MENKKITRRKFLKLSGLAGAIIGTSQFRCQVSDSITSPNYQKNLLDEKWIATSCLNCASRCGIRVKVSNGRAVNITGNLYSRVSEGKICPRSYIGLQVLYDSDRIKTPLKRTVAEKGREIDPKWIPITWDQALDEILKRLRSLREDEEPYKLIIFYGLNSVSTEDIIYRFADAFGTPNIISSDGLDIETEKAGNWMADGNYTNTAYDLDNTNYILAFGADILESSKPLSRFLRKWGKFRREKPNRTKVIVINPRYSLTASKADEWIPISPGTDGALALGIANVIISEELYDNNFVKNFTEGFETYKKLILDKYDPESVSKITGIDGDTIIRISREFAKTKPSIAIRGKESIDWPNGSFTSYAIYCLNALVGSIDTPGGVIYQEYPEYKAMPKIIEDEISKKGKLKPTIDMRKTDKFPLARTVTNQVPESILKNSPYPIELAIGFNCNFNMQAPSPERWDKALSKIPYYVHVSPFISEMALYADIVLPSTTFLEEWGYEHSPPGSGFPEVRIKQPVVAPLGQSRSAIDIIFEISRRLKGSVSQSFKNLAEDSKGFVKYRTENLISWKDFLEKGVWVGNHYEYKKYDRIFKTPSRKFEFLSGNLKSMVNKINKREIEKSNFLPHYQEVRYLGEKEKYPFILLPYQPLMVIENGSQNYPWAQEIFLPMCGVGWETLVEINSEVGKNLNLKDGQMVWIESPFKKIKVKIKLSEGIHPEILAIPIGQGHYSYGKWQKGIGVNPNEIIGIDYDAISGQTSFFNTRVKVYKA